MTTQPTHTPGQWTVILAPTQVVCGQYIIATVNRKLLADERQSLLNARLIAAAPELLAALNSVVELWENWGEHAPIPEPFRRSLEMRIEEARAAIEITKE